MLPITSVSRLKAAIQWLEVDQAIKKKHLKRQFDLTCICFKPANLLKSFLKDTVSTPHLFENVLINAAGLTTGYISKKIFIGASGNLLRKFVGSFIQFAITGFVTRHKKEVKILGNAIFDHLYRK